VRRHDERAKRRRVRGGCLRGQEPKKGAESGETCLGSCKRAMSQADPNGATRRRASVVIGG